MSIWYFTLFNSSIHGSFRGHVWSPWIQAVPRLVTYEPFAAEWSFTTSVIYLCQCFWPEPHFHDQSLPITIVSITIDKNHSQTPFLTSKVTCTVKEVDGAIALILVEHNSFMSKHFMARNTHNDTSTHT